MKGCEGCRFAEDASRYDPDDPNEYYFLTRCKLHDFITDWPQDCPDFEMEGEDEQYLQL